MKYAIELIDISAGYDSSNPIIKDVNISIEENEFLGIIGPNGGGKTTLLKVILGLLEPQSGKVIIGGKSTYSKNYKIGYVPQYSNFDKTYPISVIDVVSMGLISKSVFSKKLSDEDLKSVKNAIERVNLQQKQFDQIGHLSGGEQQRVLIARALATNPKILILDDSFSAVDTNTEEEILTKLKEFMQNRTSIIISHRISTVKNADKIIVLENGVIAEQGTHDELVELNGIYADLFTKQLLEEELKEIE